MNTAENVNNILIISFVNTNDGITYLIVETISDLWGHLAIAPHEIKTPFKKNEDIDPDWIKHYLSEHFGEVVLDNLQDYEAIRNRDKVVLRKVCRY